MSDAAFLQAMIAVEQAWVTALAHRGVAPAAVDLASVAVDEEQLAVEAEAEGNPVVPLVRRLRAGTGGPASDWVHRGLTSQDVVDTALVLSAREAVSVIRAEVRVQVDILAGLAERHDRDPMLARTLTQPAAPSTVGLKIAGWLHGLLDADQQLAELRWPLQLGGAAGTLAAIVELAGRGTALELQADLAQLLGLESSAPWHTRRTTMTRLGDAAATATQAWGRVANDVLVLGRAEVREMRDGSAGGSSSMPHKANPTLALLVRRAAILAPHLAAALHSAAAEQVDERADGAWHTEWWPLAQLLRQTAVAASQATDLVRGLVIDTDRAAGRLADVEAEVRAEQRTIADLAGRDQRSTYEGLAHELVAEALERARTYRAAIAKQEEIR